MLSSFGIGLSYDYDRVVVIDDAKYYTFLLYRIYHFNRNIFEILFECTRNCFTAADMSKI